MTWPHFGTNLDGDLTARANAVDEVFGRLDEPTRGPAKRTEVCLLLTTRSLVLEGKGREATANRLAWLSTTGSPPPPRPGRRRLATRAMTLGLVRTEVHTSTTSPFEWFGGERSRVTRGRARRFRVSPRLAGGKRIAFLRRWQASPKSPHARLVDGVFVVVVVVEWQRAAGLASGAASCAASSNRATTRASADSRWRPPPSPLLFREDDKQNRFDAP